MSFPPGLADLGRILAIRSGLLVRCDRFGSRIAARSARVPRSLAIAVLPGSLLNRPSGKLSLRSLPVRHSATRSGDSHHTTCWCIHQPALVRCSEPAQTGVYVRRSPTCSGASDLEPKPFGVHCVTEKNAFAILYRISSGHFRRIAMMLSATAIVLRAT